MLNMAGLQIYKKNFREAKHILESLLEKVPGNLQAKGVLKQIEALKN
jgi:hypothetical protein